MDKQVDTLENIVLLELAIILLNHMNLRCKLQVSTSGGISVPTLFLLRKQTGGNGIDLFHFFPFESELRMYTYERNIIALVISGRGWCVCVQYLNCFRSV